MLRNLTVMFAGAILLSVGCAESADDGAEDAPEQDVAAQLFAKASAAAFGCDGARIALQTHNGKNYLTAVAGGALGVLATSTKVESFEQFKVYEAAFGRVALQAFNGRFVGPGNSGQGGRGGNDGRQVDVSNFLLSATSFTIDASTTFKISKTKDGAWLYLQTLDGRYVSAANGGGSLVDVAWPFAGENQQLKVVCLDAKDPGTSPTPNGGAKPGADDDVSSAGPGLGG